jgi:hypothetical protein
MKKELLIPLTVLILVWIGAMTGCSDSTEPESAGVGSIRISLIDAHRSVNLTGNGRYKMNPVLRVILNQTSGSLEGAVAPVQAWALVWTTAGDDTMTA